MPTARSRRRIDGLVSRTRCGILHAAPQSRDRTKHRRSLRPRLCRAPLRKGLRAALRPGHAGGAHDAGDWMTASFTLRPYAAADEDAAITLWRDTWQQAY